jgi:gliding motility-associated-like protein
LCPFVASGTAVNTICKGTADGSITLNLVNAPANYKVAYKVTTPIGTDTVSFNSSGNTVKLNKIRDGIYNFTLTDLANPSCQAFTSVKVGYNTDINEYIDAQISGIANCVADLKAEIKEFPAPCLWKVAVYSTPTFQWEPAVNAIVKTSTGKTALQKLTAKYPAPNAYDQWTAAEVSEFYLSLNSGETISMGTALTTTPGATQWYNYRFQIYDEANNLVYTGNSPVQSAKFGYNHMIGDYTVTCPQTVPNYNISWSPSLKNLNTQPKISTGKADVKGSNQTFYVTAVNNTNPQCILTDSVVLVGDPSCSSTCKFPGVAAWRGGTTVITDTLRICKDSIVNIRLTGGDNGTFRYQLIKDNVAQTPTNTTGIFTVNTTGKYQVRVSDNADPNNTDCQVLSNNLFVRILPVNKPTAVFDVKDSICTGDSTLMRVNFTGTAPYRLRLTTPTGVVSVNNITQNNYSVWVKNAGKYRIDSIRDANFSACGGFAVKTDSFNLIVNPIPTFDLGKDTTICASKFPFVINGPAGMNTYTWTGTGTPTGANFSVSAAGKVVLNVVKNGCSFKDALTISTKPPLVVNLGPDTTQCDSSVVLDAGTGFNTYVWNENPVNNQRTFTATTSGQYRVAVATADGCVGWDTITVTINTTPIVNIGDTATICPTSPAYQFNATRPNATYVWNDGTTNAILSTTTQGDYWVDVTVNGCTARDSAYLLLSNTLNVNIGGNQTVCPGVEAEFTTNFTNATYNWNNGASTQSTFKTSSAGTVTVTVTDAGGCEGTATAQVIVNNPLSINLGNNVAFCIGDSATLALNPTRNGLNYNWNTGATTASLKVKTAGTYTLNVDSAGCTAQSSVDVVVNNLPTVDLGEDTFVCAGVNTVLTLDAGTGMQSYQWGGGASGTNRTLNVNAVGTYHVRVVDANNCVNRDTIEITERVGTPISLMDAPKEVTICPGGNHIATVPTALQNVANTSWIWNDGTTGITNEVANRVDGENVGVSIAFTNQFGCVSRDSITVKVRNTLPINIQAQTICEGEDITFNSGYSGNNYTYVWNNDVANNQATFTINNATVAQSGNISIQVTSNEGCSGDTTVTLTVNALPQPILSNDTLCAGENLVLNTGVNGSHVWSDGSTNNTLSISNATPNQSGIYSVTVTNAQNCSKDTSMRLTVYANPDFEIVSPAAACEGKTVVLSTTAPSNTHTVLWNGGSLGNTFNANTSGTYTALVTHILSGCTATKNTTLNFLTTPTVILPQDTTLCEGATWNLRALNNSSLSTYNLNWSTGASTNNITVRINGLYWLEAKNGNCASRDSIWIDYSALPVSDLVADTTICFDDAPEIILNPGRYGGQTYVWNDGSTDPVYVAKEKGRYSVEITNEFGCKIISGTEIFEDCPFAVWIPNGFTPNEDGKNDKLTIMGRGIDEVQMYIFNRWGTLIWTGNAIGDGWDGKINGNLVQQDVYVYKVDFKYTDNKNIIKSKSRTGTIVVYR